MAAGGEERDPEQHAAEHELQRAMEEPIDEPLEQHPRRLGLGGARVMDRSDGGHRSVVESHGPGTQRDEPHHAGQEHRARLDRCWSSPAGAVAVGREPDHVRAGRVLVEQQ